MCTRRQQLKETAGLRPSQCALQASHARRSTAQLQLCSTDPLRLVPTSPLRPRPIALRPSAASIESVARTTLCLYLSFPGRLSLFTAPPNAHRTPTVNSGFTCGLRTLRACSYAKFPQHAATPTDLRICSLLFWAACLGLLSGLARICSSRYSII